jgi:hypothetical protein
MADKDMRSVWLSATLGAVVLALLVVSVSAAGYPPAAIVVAPIGIGVVGHNITGILALVYPNGQPVVPKPPTLTVKACGASGCITIQVTMLPDGSFSIPVTPGFPTGIVSLYVVAGSGTDTYGTKFPSVDTLIGTLTVPAGSPPPATISQSQEPEVASEPSLYRVAAPAITNGAVEQSPRNYTIPGILAFLVIAGAVMVAAPRRRPT